MSGKPALVKAPLPVLCQTRSRAAQIIDSALAQIDLGSEEPILLLDATSTLSMTVGAGRPAGTQFTCATPKTGDGHRSADHRRGP